MVETFHVQMIIFNRMTISYYNKNLDFFSITFLLDSNIRKPLAF
jgi:hypothetical protein